MNRRKSLLAPWWPATGLMLSGWCLVAAAQPALGHCLDGPPLPDCTATDRGSEIQSRLTQEPVPAPTAMSPPTPRKWAADAQPLGIETWERSLLQVAQGATDRILVEQGVVDRSLLVGLGQVPSLRELLLDGGVVDDQGLAVIVDRCPSLEHLRLRHSPIGDQGAAQLARLEHLTVLNLPQSRLTQVGIQHLQALPQLQVLRLGGSQLDDQAIEAIVRLPALTSLHLIGPQLTDQALERLAEAPRLASFYLDDCSLSPQAWERLLARRRGLHVHLDQWHRDRQDSTP